MTLLGLSHSPSIDCRGGRFSIWESSYISIDNISFNNCSVEVYTSNHVMIADSTHYYNQQKKIIRIYDTSNITITNSIFQNFEISVTSGSDITFANSSCQYCSAEFSDSRVTVIDSNFNLTSNGYYFMYNPLDITIMSTVIMHWW